jgi:predicted Zn-ribbon and HTH transcriptional regulator
MTIIGPIRRAAKVLAVCSNDDMLRRTQCNWRGWVWCPNPFYVMRCPRCNSRIELPQA